MAVDSILLLSARSIPCLRIHLALDALLRDAPTQQAKRAARLVRGSVGQIESNVYFKQQTRHHVTALSQRPDSGTRPSNGCAFGRRMGHAGELKTAVSTPAAIDETNCDFTLSPGLSTFNQLVFYTATPRPIVSRRLFSSSRLGIASNRRMDRGDVAAVACPAAAFQAQAFPAAVRNT